MEWFAKAAGQSVNNLKFNPIVPEEMVSYHAAEPLFWDQLVCTNLLVAKWR